MTYRRNRQKLNAGWRFRFEGDDWESVSLPHSWNAFDTMDTRAEHHYRRGKAYYELDFCPPAGLKNRRICLEFEAVAQRAWVYFDGELLGKHHGGYTAFTLEIPNRVGKVLVIADNSPDPDLIPSDMSDFFLYGGITRNIWLYHTGDSWLDDLHIHPDADGRIQIQGRVAGDFSEVLELRIENQTHHFSLTETLFSIEIQIEAPRLWSTTAPELYDLEIQLGQADEVTSAIGFRRFDFPEWGIFSLNGESLLLRGTHRHEDWAGYGGAVPDAIAWEEFRLIKEAGFNFVRLGHYPQSRVALEACDKLGLLVWEELPWCRGGLGGELFKKYTREMLVEMIKQHQHHPSIIFWGLGNELDWESEHPDSTDEKVCDFLQELHHLAQRLDPSRLTALRRFDLGASVVDVYSPSIWAGWYRGRYEDYEMNLREAMKKYPRFIHAEWGGDSHAGRFSSTSQNRLKVESSLENAEESGIASSSEGFARYSKDGDWSESYILDLMDWHLRIQAKMPNFAGSLQWVFKDFGTPLRPENPIPYVNQKGLLDREGKPKDSYWLFKAHQSHEAVLHFEQYLWREAAPSHKLRVISNCAELELFMGGKSCGRQRRGDSAIFEWDLALEDLSILRVCGGNHEANLLLGQFQTGSKAVDFRLTLGNGILGTRIGLELLDSAALPVYTDERRVHFRALLGGKLSGLMGYMGGSEVVETANGQAFIQAEIETRLELEIAVEGIGKRFIEIDKS